ncbi:MAG: enoyl-CoA hydratase/isomerase family protein [Elusimicrobia bacterium]|nr:enoyl-CoA hydratase/isomerase family protein [Elusimicrobiota bacterium]
MDRIVLPGEAVEAARALLPDKMSPQIYESPELTQLRERYSDGALVQTLSQLKRKAPLAVKVANELIDDGLRGSLEEGLKLELSLLKRIFSTRDAREGLSALLERRPPAFEGR